MDLKKTEISNERTRTYARTIHIEIKVLSRILQFFNVTLNAIYLQSLFV